jgi:hypothetical protein
MYSKKKEAMHKNEISRAKTKIFHILIVAHLISMWAHWWFYTCHNDNQSHSKHCTSAFHLIHSTSNVNLECMETWGMGRGCEHSP